MPTERTQRHNSSHNASEALAEPPTQPLISLRPLRPLQFEKNRPRKSLTILYYRVCVPTMAVARVTVPQPSLQVQAEFFSRLRLLLLLQSIFLVKPKITFTFIALCFLQLQTLSELHNADRIHITGCSIQVVNSSTLFFSKITSVNSFFTKPVKKSKYNQIQEVLVKITCFKVRLGVRAGYIRPLEMSKKSGSGNTGCGVYSISLGPDAPKTLHTCSHKIHPNALGYEKRI